MQTTSDTGFVIGTFKRELKNRFLCEVSIDGEDVVCYVPSSCHLSNFLKLEGKQVLLVPTQAPNARTKFALFAVPYKRNYILLNTSMANRAVESSLQSRRFSYLEKRKDAIKEHTLEGYKADLFLPASNTVIEIKSVISLDPIGRFPTVYSERTLKQLELMLTLLHKGYKVCLIIVSLHPYLKELQIENNTEFYSALKKCIEAGLLFKAYTCKLHDQTVLIDKEIHIEF